MGFAQFEAKKSEIHAFPLMHTVRMDTLSAPAIYEVLESPAHDRKGGNLKERLDDQKLQTSRRLKKTENNRYLERSEDLSPEVKDGYLGIAIAAGVPNDNSIAVSNDGKVISALNTWVVLLEENGQILSTRSLGAFARGALGRLDRFYDPKVLYDPQNDRFILVFLEGNASADSRIVVGFSKTSDPSAEWNFYALNGTPFGGKFWSDYPIVGINEQDLFITVNILRDSVSWQEGFEESVIWQVHKEDGYRGDSLRTSLWSDIAFNNKPVWSICAVQPAEGGVNSDMYFLSVRPADEKNDTVFMHHISDHLLSGRAKFSSQILKSELAYGLPPSAMQPTPLDTPMLQTNDARVLSAVLQNNKIQYVQTTSLPESMRSGILHSVIDDVESRPVIRSHYIQTDSLELAYPSIAWIGDTDNPQATAITFSHSSEDVLPGTSVIIHNRMNEGPSLYSPLFRTKEGDGYIDHPNLHGNERWGDYTQVQKRYNKPGEFWLSGTFGNDLNLYGTWVSALEVSFDLNLGGDVLLNKAYPIPAGRFLTLEFDLKEGDEDVLIDFDLINMEGKVVEQFRLGPLNGGYHKKTLSLPILPAGMYVIRNNYGLANRKIMIE